MKKTWPFFAGGLIFIFATLVVAGPQISNPPGVQTATAPLAVTGQDVSITCAGNGQAGALCPTALSDGGAVYAVDAGFDPLLIALPGGSLIQEAVGNLAIKAPSAGLVLFGSASQALPSTSNLKTDGQYMYSGTAGGFVASAGGAGYSSLVVSGQTALQILTGSNIYLGTGGVAGLSYNGTGIASSVVVDSQSGFGSAGASTAQGMSFSGATTQIRGTPVLLQLASAAYAAAYFTGGAVGQLPNTIYGDTNFVGGADGGLVGTVSVNGSDGGRELVPVVRPYAGYPPVQEVMEHGYWTLASSSDTVTFNTPFSTAASPDGGVAILCGATVSPPSAGGQVEASLATVSAVIFSRDAGGSFNWFCWGPR